LKKSKVRKQVYDLTLSDLNECPVWEFALDEECEEGQDEATVRPSEYDLPFDPGNGLAVVKAQFKLADGTIMEGYLSPQIEGFKEIGYIQPVIIAPRGQVGFWHGIFKPSKKQILEYCNILNKSPSEIFPINYKSAVEIVDGPVEGVISDFLYKSSR